MRLIPATPIADSKPPMVVGMRHTSSATRTVMVTGAPSFATATLKRENGNKVAVASKNTSVRAMSRIVKAMHEPDVQEKCAKLGLDIVADTPAEFATYIKNDVAKWQKVITDAKIPQIQ